MKVVIIDDEKLAINVLSIMLKKLTQFSIDIKGTFTNAMDALTLFEQQAIDVVFLDIEMIDVQGIEFAQKLVELYPNLQIIFVTAHSEFAIDAYDLEASAYLLKPVRENRLVRALTKAQQLAELNNQEIASAQQTATMQASVLGSFQLLDRQNEIVKWRTRKTRELFLYLWFHRTKPLSNVLIIEELWPELEYEKASSNLHTTIYQLRKLLKQNGNENPISLVNNHYQLNVEIATDYDELMQLLDKSSFDEQTIAQVLHYYSGDFLAEEEYHWALGIQLRLRQRVLHVLETYISNNADIKVHVKLNCLQKMLELDEYNETYMLLLFQLLIEQNKIQECIEHYKTIQQKLQVELGVPIPKDIQEMYAQFMMKL